MTRRPGFIVFWSPRSVAIDARVIQKRQSPPCGGSGRRREREGQAFANPTLSSVGLGLLAITRCAGSGSGGRGARA